MSASPVWHPFTQHGLETPIPLVTRGEGATLWTDDGRRIVDGISSWWVTTHGHNHPRIVRAIAEQAAKLDQIIFAGWTHEPAEMLARALVELMPRPLDHVFFSDSGSTISAAGVLSRHSASSRASVACSRPSAGNGMRSTSNSSGA